MQNIQELFGALAGGVQLAAAQDTGWPDMFNLGVFVTKPNRQVYKELIEMAVPDGSMDNKIARCDHTQSLLKRPDLYVALTKLRIFFTLEHREAVWMDKEAGKDTCFFAGIEKVVNSARSNMLMIPMLATATSGGITTPLVSPSSTPATAAPSTSTPAISTSCKQRMGLNASG
ncbi:hypothetical protein HDU93_004202, partial [Gonapodya sp. JEL0774]